jgi:hypothetical protein
MYHPLDLGEDAQALEVAARRGLREGRLALDRWDGGPGPDAPDADHLTECWFLRPRAKGRGAVAFSYRPGECVHLTATGCALPWAMRPLQCKALVPNPAAPGECLMADGGDVAAGAYSVRALAEAWLPYQGAVRKLLREVWSQGE